MLRRTPLNRGTSQLRRSGFKKATYTTLKGHRIALKRTKLRVVGKESSSELKQEIQRLVREIVIKRDGGCILKNIRHCGGEVGQTVIQADHLVTRANSATYADTRLIVCLCKGCHGWKHWNEDEYNDLVRSLLPQDRNELWAECEEDRKRHFSYKPDWKMAIIALNQELKQYE